MKTPVKETWPHLLKLFYNLMLIRKCGYSIDRESYNYKFNAPTN